MNPVVCFDVCVPPHVHMHVLTVECKQRGVGCASQMWWPLLPAVMHMPAGWHCTACRLAAFCACRCAVGPDLAELCKPHLPPYGDIALSVWYCISAAVFSF
jgi:hypothetical protein